MGAFEQGLNEMRKCDMKRSWGESTLRRGNSIGKKPGCRNMASPRNRVECADQSDRSLQTCGKPGGFITAGPHGEWSHPPHMVNKPLREFKNTQESFPSTCPKDGASNHAFHLQGTFLAACSSHPALKQASAVFAHPAPISPFQVTAPQFSPPRPIKAFLLATVTGSGMSIGCKPSQ